jgi:hypothetical protein
MFKTLLDKEKDYYFKWIRLFNNDIIVYLVKGHISNQIFKKHSS